MKFLLINDDGIDAPGINALLECATKRGSSIITAAPTQQLSGCSHQVTTKLPIKVEEQTPIAAAEMKRWAIHGTPVDCARLALSTLCPDNDIHIDWVLSGINAGGNLGTDVYTSGTVAAIREAAFFGVPGIALSHHKKEEDIDWKLAQNRATQVLKQILARPQRTGSYWNVNLPHRNSNSPEPQIIYCPLDTNPIQMLFSTNNGTSYLYSGKYRDRPRSPGADVEVCFSGNISVTELQL